MPVFGRLILAPMDGFSDQPFREICREMGSAVSYTEFINVLDVTPKMLPYVRKRISFSGKERPVGFQLYGSSAEEILPAALRLMDFQPDFFDINIGCSERRVAARGAGAGLLDKPEEIKKIARRLVGQTRLPVTAKIRLGPDKTKLNFLNISKLLEDCGISMIAVHGRTRDQRWREPATWEPIADVVRSVKIPVVGNGDIQTVSDIDRMFAETGCAAVMIGRSAIGNPWLFSRTDKASLTRKQILDMIKDHWHRFSLYEEVGESKVPFNKHLKAYLSSPQFFGLDIRGLISSDDPAGQLFSIFPG